MFFQTISCKFFLDVRGTGSLSWHLVPNLKVSSCTLMWNLGPLGLLIAFFCGINQTDGGKMEMKKWKREENQKLVDADAEYIYFVGSEMSTKLRCKAKTLCKGKEEFWEWKLWNTFSTTSSIGFFAMRFPSMGWLLRLPGVKIHLHSTRLLHNFSHRNKEQEQQLDISL